METKKPIKLIFLFSLAFLNFISFRAGYTQEVYINARFDLNAEGFTFIDNA